MAWHEDAVLDLCTEKCKIERWFKSKKHHVALVLIDGKRFVAKIFSPEHPHGKENEARVLRLVAGQGIRVPKVVRETEAGLLLSYVEGRRVFDIFCEGNMEEKADACRATARWLADFHERLSSNGQLRGDPNLKNYLISPEGGEGGDDGGREKEDGGGGEETGGDGRSGGYGGKEEVWGLDFEEARAGEPLEDIGGLCAAILLGGEPFSSEKPALCECAVLEYAKMQGGEVANTDLDDPSLWLYTAKWIEYFAAWRSDREELMAKASVIRKMGYAAACGHRIGEGSL